MQEKNTLMERNNNNNNNNYYYYYFQMQKGYRATYRNALYRTLPKKKVYDMCVNPLC
jgi:hypothetical protein